MTESLRLFPVESSQTSFRPIHYLGGKTRLLDVIEQAIDELSSPEDGPICDLFTGSGVVAARLARRRDVVAVDIQEYARVLASALVAPNVPPVAGFLAHSRDCSSRIPISSWVAHEQGCLAEAEGDDARGLCEILEMGSLERLDTPPLPRSRATVVTRYYGGVYFSYLQAVALDGLAEAARSLPPHQRDTALAVVLSVASEIVTSVGNHFAQPVRPRTSDGRIKRATIRSVIRQRALDPYQLAEQKLSQYATITPPATTNETLRGDYREALNSLSDIAAVYADPPYTRDHYSRFYHVLETIALGDEPEVTRVTIGGRTEISRGLYRVERHQSPFCIKSEAPYAFSQLFEGVRSLGCPLVLSYSPYLKGGHPRLMTVEQIQALASEYFDIVEVRSAGRLAHSKLNASRLRLDSLEEAEVLFVCR